MGRNQHHQITMSNFPALVSSRFFVLKIVLVSLFFISLWSLDTSVSALINSGWVSNGWFVHDPAKTYHVNILILSLVFLISIFWVRK